MIVELALSKSFQTLICTNKYWIVSKQDFGSKIPHFIIIREITYKYISLFPDVQSLLGPSPRNNRLCLIIREFEIQKQDLKHDFKQG